MKKQIITLAASLVLSFTLHAQTTVSTLSATVFAQKLKEQPKWPLVDVRTPAEFSKGHLPGAVNIDWNNPDFEKMILALDKDTPVLVYCQSGKRSVTAVARMRELGFTKVTEMEGGFLQWRAAGLPEEAEKPTLSGLTLQQFKSLLQTEKTVLVDAYADWCGPCKKMAPFIEEIASGLQDQVKVIRLNVDDNPGLSTALRIKALPTLLVYKGGKLKKISIGYMPKSKIVALLK